MNSASQGRMRLSYLWRTILPTAALLLLMVGAVILLCIGIPLYVADDVQSAPRRRAEADVVAVRPMAGGRFRDPASSVTLRLAGMDVDCTSLVPLRVGDRVRVDYRQGRSGRVYVSGIARTGP